MTTLLLASSSPARQALLQRLGLPFSALSPDIDETPHASEDIVSMVGRLSLAKAQALAHRHQGLVIGSDQALGLEGRILGKPGNHEAATRQLSQLSGRRVTFQTGLCLLNTVSGQHQLIVEPFEVEFRSLNAAQIERYLRADTPYGCAGSFKSEALGITLFKSWQGRDPNSLIGLPLMALVDMLANEGIELP
ncbi:MAG: nucleoside triphosphate pyrophosphatase [Moraxellaceae bacterium]|nr:nucleoside triphosphate pyrophosphatase [Moraxellaceae bacterium]